MVKNKTSRQQRSFKARIISLEEVQSKLEEVEEEITEEELGLNTVESLVDSYENILEREYDNL